MFCECSIAAWQLRAGTFKFIKKLIDVKRGSGTKRYFGDLGKTVSQIVLAYMLMSW